MHLTCRVENVLKVEENTRLRLHFSYHGRGSSLWKTLNELDELKRCIEKKNGEIVHVPVNAEEAHDRKCQAKFEESIENLSLDSVLLLCEEFELPFKINLDSRHKSEFKQIAAWLVTESKRNEAQEWLSKIRQEQNINVGIIGILCVLIYMRQKTLTRKLQIFFGAASIILAILIRNYKQRESWLRHIETLREEVILPTRVAQELGDVEEDIDVPRVLENMATIYEIKIPGQDTPQKKHRKSMPRVVVDDTPTVQLMDALELKGNTQEVYDTGSRFIASHGDTTSFAVSYRVVRSGFQIAKQLQETHGATHPDRLALLTRIVKTSKLLIQRYPENALAHKMYAICGQDITNHQGNKERLLGGILFEKHTKEAIRLDNTDPETHFMLGRFQYEIARLSWSERVAARAIFGKEPPQATYDEALASFQRVSALRPNGNAFPQDNVEIAKCYKQLGNRVEARNRLEQVVACVKETPDLTPKDQAALEEALALLPSI